MARVASIILAAGLLAVHPAAAHAQEPPVTSTTVATNGGTGDDFLTLYPQYQPGDHDYLAPGDNALPVMGTSARVPSIALVLLGAGLLTRRRSRPVPLLR